MNRTESDKALLNFGDPLEALAETIPAFGGQGHVECLLHSVAARALWKLGRLAEARQAAAEALAAAPNDERRSDLSSELEHMFRAPSS